MPAGRRTNSYDRTFRVTPLHRRFRAAVRGLAVTASLAAASALAAPAEVSIIGDWQIVEATPGPWTDAADRPALMSEGKRMLKLVISFAASQVHSKNRAFNCTRGVIYEPNSLDPDSIFSGNLPEPNPTAAALRMGFGRSGIPGVDVKCINAIYTFHFRDPNTALFNLDNVIYTLKRR